MGIDHIVDVIKHGNIDLFQFLKELNILERGSKKKKKQEKNTLFCRVFFIPRDRFTIS